MSNQERFPGSPGPDSAMNRRLNEERRVGEERRQESRRADDAPKSVQPSTDALLVELRGLASTVRQCQRNGHPDVTKHLEALLTKLGA